MRGWPSLDAMTLGVDDYQGGKANIINHPGEGSKEKEKEKKKKKYIYGIKWCSQRHLNNINKAFNRVIACRQLTEKAPRRAYGMMGWVAVIRVQLFSTRH
jgi:hypothetical protein